MNLLQMSFSGAVFILAVVIIRAMTINRLPKKTLLFLWDIVLFRLLVPFSIPSTFSVYSLLHWGFWTPEGSRMQTENPVFFLPQEPSGGTNPIVQTTENTLPSISVWFIIWCIGMICCGIFFLTVYLRSRMEFQTSLPVQNDYARKWLEMHPLMRPLSIRQLDKISTPLTYGIFYPVILLPKTMELENRRQLNYVLSHEYVHIRRFDAVTKLIATTAFCIHWFNPMVWIMYLLFNRDIELACDESVIQQFGQEAKSEYASTLIDMEEQKNRLIPFGSSFSKNAIEERITAIMKTKRITKVTFILSTLVIVCMVVLFATSAPKENSKPYASINSPVEISPSATAALVKDISKDTIMVDVVEYVTDETFYKFIDWNGDFTKLNHPAYYETTDVRIFQKYMETYDNAQPGMPFFFEVEDGVVKKVTEQPMS